MNMAINLVLQSYTTETLLVTQTASGPLSVDRRQDRKILSAPGTNQIAEFSSSCMLRKNNSQCVLVNSS